MVRIDWRKLGFEYQRTRANLRYTWEGDAWGEGRLATDDALTLSVASTCLHYGQSCFEGLKAFAAKDGSIGIFRPAANAQRMAEAARFLLAPAVPEAMFVEAVTRVVRENLDYVPPYGTGGSLYIRPLLIGSGAGIGVKPSSRYEFIVFVVPVGAYYRDGITPVDALVVEDFDRAAPQGTGCYKVSGNYAAGLKSGQVAKDRGFGIALYVDAKTHTLVDEFGTSNLVAATRSGHYVTPASRSILPSITNDSLMQVAKDLGIPVERRPVPIAELADFAEVGACGTAVVITPVGRIVHGARTYTYPPPQDGSVLMRLYRTLTGIQVGDLPDRHGWRHLVNA